MLDLAALLFDDLAGVFPAADFDGVFLADLAGVFLADLTICLVLFADGLAALFLADLTGVVGLAGVVGSTTGVTGLAGDSTFLALELDLLVADFLTDYTLIIRYFYLFSRWFRCWVISFGNFCMY